MQFFSLLKALFCYTLLCYLVLFFFTQGYGSRERKIARKKPTALWAIVILQGAMGNRIGQDITHAKLQEAFKHFSGNGSICLEICSGRAISYLQFLKK